MSGETIPLMWPIRHVDASNLSRKFDEAATRRNKVSLFAQYTPWENLMFTWGFEYTNDNYLFADSGYPVR